jgi:Leucine-rich repeat (LRR) protein
MKSNGPVTRVDWSKRGLKDLLDSPVPPHTTTLILDGNKFTEIPVGLPAGLRVLSMNRNCLREVDCGRLPADLQQFMAEENEIYEFRGMMPLDLKKAWLASNRISRQPMLPSSLTWLSLERNRLEYVGWLPDALEWLDVSENPRLQDIGALPLALKVLVASELPSLKSVWSFPRSLEFLHLQRNPALTFLPDLDCPRLRVLCLDGTPVKELHFSYSVSKLARLTVLGDDVQISGHVRVGELVVDGQLREIDVPDEETEMVASAIATNPIIHYSDLEKFFEADVI